MAVLNQQSTFLKLWKHLSKAKWNLLTLIILMSTINYMGNREFIDILSNYLIIFLFIFVIARLFIINYLLAFLTSLLISLELTFLLVSGERVSVTVLSASIDTDLSIASGTTMPFFIKAIPSIIIFSFLFIMSMSEIKKLKFKIYLLLIPCLAFITIFSVYSKLDKYQNYLVEWGGYNKTDYSSKKIYFQKLFYHRDYPLILGDGFYIATEFYELYQAKKLINHNVWPEGIVFNKDKTSPLKVIIIVGESSTVVHYSLYGYPYQTTPRMDEYYKNKEITKLDNIISGAALTRDSLRFVLSFATPLDEMRFFNYKNMVDMAKLANYQTIWISSTYESGPYTGYIATIEQSSDKYFNNRNNEILKDRDDLSIPKVLATEYKKGEKQFFILHMLGSHIPYESRYDKEDEHLVTTAKATNYDRSIHHTDRMLDKIIKFVKQQNENTLVFYFPDHGDLVTKGHGLVFGNSIEQYNIPIIIYQNKNTINMSKLIDKYRTKDGIYNINNNHYVIPEILGFDINTTTIQQAKKEGEYIYHPNGKVYKYIEVLTNGFEKSNVYNNP